MQRSDVGQVWLGAGVGGPAEGRHAVWQTGRETGAGPGVSQGLSPSGGDGRGDWEGSSTCV